MSKIKKLLSSVLTIMFIFSLITVSPINRPKKVAASTGSIVKLGTLYVNNTKFPMPTKPWASSHSISGTYGNLINYQNYNGAIEIKDSDTNDAYKLQWVEVNENGKKLYIADRNLLEDISWYSLNSLGLIAGKTVSIDGNNYKLRVLTSKWSASNEWDRYISNVSGISGLPMPTTTDLDTTADDNIDFNSTHNQFWHWYSIQSISQEMSTTNYFNALCGGTGANYFMSQSDTASMVGIGWRPVLELIDNAPQISDSDRNLGVYDNPFTTNYSITDADNDTFSVVEKVDNTTIRTITNQISGSSYTLSLYNQWNSLAYGKHNLTVTATDSKGVYSLRTWTFYKSGVTGTLIKLGTLYVNNTKVLRPTNPWYPNQAGYPGGNLSSYYNLGQGTILIKDTDIDDSYKLQWVEIDDSGKKLYICDRNILADISWNDLNAQGLITGKVVTIDGQPYKLRVLTGGSYYRSGTDGTTGGTPVNNEWDKYICNEANLSGLVTPTSSDLDGTVYYEDYTGVHNQLWNWYHAWSIMQEPWAQDSTRGTYRGVYSAKYISYGYMSSNGSGCWRPVLEPLNNAPYISDTDRDLGGMSTPVTQSYKVTDVENDTFSVVEKVDGTTIRSLVNQTSGTNYTLDLTTQWASLSAGVHTITITATDTKGAYSVRTWTFTKVDGTPPIVTLTTTGGNTGSWTNNIQATITANDTTTGGSNISNIYYYWSSTNTPTPADTSFINSIGTGIGTSSIASTVLTPPQGAYYIWYYAKDAAGNSSVKTCSAGQFMYDNVIPAISITPSTSGWTNSALQITITGSDATSGVNNIYYKWDNQNVTAPTSGYTAVAGSTTTATQSSEGQWYLWYYCTDNAGNKSSATAAVSGVFKVDTTAPTAPIINSNGSTWGKDNVTVTISGSTDSVSGIQKYQYNLDNTGWQDYITTITIPSTSTGSHVIQARAFDYANNISPVSTYTFGIDATPPSVSLDKESQAWSSTDISVKITATDIGSCVNNIYYKWDTQNITPPTGGYTAVAGNTAVATQSNNGEWYLWYYADDNSNNVSAIKVSAGKFQVRKTAPRVSVDINSKSVVDTSITVNITATSTDSTVQAIYYVWSTSKLTEPEPTSFTEVQGSSAAVTQSRNGTWYLWYYAVDNYGCSSKVYNNAKANVSGAYQITSKPVVTPPSNSNGNGSESDPILINKATYTLELNNVNGSYIQYSIDGVSWSPWEGVNSSDIEKTLNFNNIDGLHTADVRTKFNDDFNDLSDVSPTTTYYFMLDTTPPKIDISTTTSSFVAADGNITFVLQGEDNWNGDLKVDMTIYDETMNKQAESLNNMLSLNNYSTIPVSNLELGKYYYVLFVVHDKAGNVTKQKVTVYSR